MNIQVSVRNKIATLAVPASIVCGNSDYTITFDFDDEWSAETVKTARFAYRRSGENKYKDVPFNGNTVNVPKLSNITAVLVGVYAGDLRTTAPAIIGCEKSILCGGGAHEEPPEDVYNQLLALVNGMVEQSASHLTSKDNPHKVTAAQVGARPNTWMPTAQEVGAAPAGYGLGDFSGTPCSDCNAAVQVGFYRMVGSGAINTPSEIYAFKWGSLIVDATISTVFQTIKSAYATAHRAGTKSGSTVTWGEWEYSISPMDVGVEYRTTERWNGKPVYTMMANIGALPNNTGKTTEDGPLPMGIAPISAYGIGLNGKTGAVIPSRHIYLSVYGEWGTVYVNTDSDYSDYTGYIIVKYVRE